MTGRHQQQGTCPAGSTSMHMLLNSSICSCMLQMMRTSQGRVVGGYDWSYHCCLIPTCGRPGFAASRCPAMNCLRPSLHSRRGRSAHAVAARTGEREGERTTAVLGCVGTVAGRWLLWLPAALGGDLSTAPAPLRRMGFLGGAGACAGLRIRSSILALSARLSSSAR